VCKPVHTPDRETGVGSYRRSWHGTCKGRGQVTEAPVPTEETLLGAFFDVRNPMEVSGGQPSRPSTPDRLPRHADPQGSTGTEEGMHGGVALTSSRSSAGRAPRRERAAMEPRRGSEAQEGSSGRRSATVGGRHGLDDGARPWSRRPRRDPAEGAFWQRSAFGSEVDDVPSRAPERVCGGSARERGEERQEGRRPR
jgi:hypothetical protein